MLSSLAGNLMKPELGSLITLEVSKVTGPSSSVLVSDLGRWVRSNFLGVSCFLGLLRGSELTFVFGLGLDFVFLGSLFAESFLGFGFDLAGSLGFKRSTFKSPRFEIGVELDAFFFGTSFDFDEEMGGWYPMLNAENVRTDTHAGPNHIGPMVKCYPSKTDYHPLAACYEVLRTMGEATP